MNKGELIMFREMRRSKQSINEDAILSLLENVKRGVLALHGDYGYPYAIPLDFYYEPKQKRIYFHGSKVGHKIDAINQNSKACFTIYGNEFYKQNEWAPYVQSVIAFGQCYLISDEEEIQHVLYQLAKKYYPNEEMIQPMINAHLHAVQIFALDIEHITGKQIQEE